METVYYQLLRANWKKTSTREAFFQRLISDLAQILPQHDALLRQKFEQNILKDGYAFAQEKSRQTDQFIVSLTDYTIKTVFSDVTDDDPFDLIATGGYGRQELSPYSDIDLLFLIPEATTKRNFQIQQRVEFILYVLWDLGFKVGYAVRQVDQCLRAAKETLSVCTSLLESRLLWGKGRLYNTLQTRYQRSIVKHNSNFFFQKLEETQERHQRMQSSLSMLEPDIKHSQGGLRDCQVLLWWAKFYYRITSLDQLGTVFYPQEIRLFLDSYRFLWTVRCHLHFICGRAQERLEMSLQESIADKMRYASRGQNTSVKRLIKRYYWAAKNIAYLTSLLSATLEIDLQKNVSRYNFWRVFSRSMEETGFRAQGKWLLNTSETQFQNDPKDIIKLFILLQKKEYALHPTLVRNLSRSLGWITALRQDPEANQLFLTLFNHRYNPEPCLRYMNQTSVLRRFIPEFGRIVAQMPYDLYHHYTVDEHTLRALGILYRVKHRLSDLPNIEKVAQEISSHPRVLYLALLFHDLAKDRSSDHAADGALIAERLCRRFNLPQDETDAISWLVGSHLFLSHMAFKRDLNDMQTILSVSSRVGNSIERLNLLYLMTAVDIQAVSPHQWTTWRAALLETLYNRVKTFLSGDLTSQDQERRETIQNQLRQSLIDWSWREIERFISLFPKDYWLSFSLPRHLLHAAILRAEWQRPSTAEPFYVFKREDDPYHSLTRITVYAPKTDHTFALLTGLMTIVGANIIHLNCFTIGSMMLFVFEIQDGETGGCFQNLKKIARLSVLFEEMREDTFSFLHHLETALPLKQSPIPIQVEIDQKASQESTVIEVRGMDRLGFLYGIARALTLETDLQISWAKVATFGNRAYDVFYVQDRYGDKIVEPARLAPIVQTLEKGFNALPTQSKSRNSP